MFKRSHFSIYFFCLLLLQACSRELGTNDPGFTMTASKTSVKAGQAITFTVKGDPDIITFYSGEIGKRYEYRGRNRTEGTPVMSFRSLRANGSQPNSLSVLIADNFEGVAVNDTTETITRIGRANWTDLTSGITLSAGSLTSSGAINLSAYADASKPVYIAFRYTAQAGSIQNKWTIDSFSVKNQLSDATSYVIANMNTPTTSFTNYGAQTYSPGFVNYRIQNTYNWIVSSTSLVITGANAANWATEPAEAWTIIGPVDLKKVTPDLGQVVKSGSQNAADVRFNYTYNTPGIYNAVFLGGQVNIDQNEVSTQAIQITVE